MASTTTRSNSRPIARGATGSIGTSCASSSGKHADLRPSWVERWPISRSQVKSLSGSLGEWVAAYADRWFEVDRLQRRLDGWVARMEEEPEAEQAIAVVRLRLRRAPEADGDRASQRRSRARAGRCRVLFLRRASIPTSVGAAGARVAYFVVDALRYEMGAELLEQLQGRGGARDQPGGRNASDYYASRNGSTPPGCVGVLLGRRRQREARHADRADLHGEPQRPSEIPEGEGSRCRRSAAREAAADAVIEAQATIGDASLVLVRSQEIDLAGEIGLRAATSWRRSSRTSRERRGSSRAPA